MKILTWNCNSAFRNKFELISNFNADICIVQECENPAESTNKEYINWASNYLWVGDNKNKGLGVFAKDYIKLEKLEWSNIYKNHSVKYFLPCRINNGFNLLAVWAHKNNSPNFGYIGQLWKYIQINKNKLERTLIAGDFNSNAIWDEWDIWWNHTDVVNELNSIGIESLYHKTKQELQGKESKPTFYLHRDLLKPYHIDYIFADKSMINHILKFEIGEPQKWLEISDHMPVLCEFELV